MRRKLASGCLGAGLLASFALAFSASAGPPGPPARAQTAKLYDRDLVMPPFPNEVDLDIDCKFLQTPRTNKALSNAALDPDIVGFPRGRLGRDGVVRNVLLAHAVRDGNLAFLQFNAKGEGSVIPISNADELVTTWGRDAGRGLSLLNVCNGRQGSQLAQSFFSANPRNHLLAIPRTNGAFAGTAWFQLGALEADFRGPSPLSTGRDPVHGSLNPAGRSYGLNLDEIYRLRRADRDLATFIEGPLKGGGLGLHGVDLHMRGVDAPLSMNSNQTARLIRGEKVYVTPAQMKAAFGEPIAAAAPAPSRPSPGYVGTVGRSLCSPNVVALGYAARQATGELKRELMIAPVRRQSLWQTLMGPCKSDRPSGGVYQDFSGQWFDRHDQRVGPRPPLE